MKKSTKPSVRLKVMEGKLTGHPICMSHISEIDKGGCCQAKRGCVVARRCSCQDKITKTK